MNTVISSFYERLENNNQEYNNNINLILDE